MHEILCVYIIRCFRFTKTILELVVLFFYINLSFRIQKKHVEMYEMSSYKFKLYLCLTW